MHQERQPDHVEFDQFGAHIDELWTDWIVTCVDIGVSAKRLIKVARLVVKKTSHLPIQTAFINMSASCAHLIAKYLSYSIYGSSDFIITYSSINYSWFRSASFIHAFIINDGIVTACDCVMSPPMGTQPCMCTQACTCMHVHTHM